MVWLRCLNPGTVDVENEAEARRTVLAGCQRPGVGLGGLIECTVLLILAEVDLMGGYLPARTGALSGLDATVVVLFFRRAAALMGEHGAGVTAADVTPAIMVVDL